MEGSINLNIIQFAAILFTGLLAGLMYGYSCSVSAGLGSLHDDIYLLSFQSINVSIQNPYFFLSFIGNLLILPIASWLAYQHYNSVTFYFLAGATVVYIIGVFGVTVFGNIPLNQQLANFKVLNATESEIRQMRMAFESSWNNYHTIRTVAAITAFCLAILSLLTRKI
ncbi:MAG TPA: anthrone oxygenase family protein [Cytophagaceae bacterium]|jgi:uncharacterized membrane protein